MCEGQVALLNEGMLELEALGVAVMCPWEAAATLHDHELAKTLTETLHFEWWIWSETRCSAALDDQAYRAGIADCEHAMALSLQADVS